jgi:hypothetical protein
LRWLRRRLGRLIVVAAFVVLLVPLAAGRARRWRAGRRVGGSAAAFARVPVPGRWTV